MRVHREVTLRITLPKSEEIVDQHNYAKNVSFISYNVQAWIKAFLLREFLFEVGTNKGWRCVEVMDVTMRVAMIWGCVIRGGVIFCGTHYEIDPPPPSQIGSCETIPFLLGEIFSLNPMIWKNNWSDPKLQLFQLSLKNDWAFVQRVNLTAYPW